MTRSFCQGRAPQPTLLSRLSANYPQVDYIFLGLLPSRCPPELSCTHFKGSPFLAQTAQRKQQDFYTYRRTL